MLLCHDERLGRRVAVKRLHADSPEDVEQRFVREAKLGASLNHPNLVSVFDTAVDDEGVLIVMEYVEGESLAAALLRGPLEPDTWRRIARELGDALDHAHGHGIVHRDVKPGNVLLRDDGVDEAGRPRHRGVGRPDPHDPQRRPCSAARPTWPRAAGGPRRRPGARTCTRWRRSASRRWRAARPPGAAPMEIAHRIATRAPPDVREHVPGRPPPLPPRAQRAAWRASPPTAGLGRRARRRPRGRARGREPPSRWRRRRRGGCADRTGLAATRPAPLDPSRSRDRRAAAPPPPRRVAALLPVALLRWRPRPSPPSFCPATGDPPARAGSRGSGRRRASRLRRPSARSPGQPRRTPTSNGGGGAGPGRRACPPEPPATVDPASGAQLNEQGFALMGRGDYAGAVPVLQQAVASWPEDSPTSTTPTRSTTWQVAQPRRAARPRRSPISRSA